MHCGYAVDFSCGYAVDLYEPCTAYHTRVESQLEGDRVTRFTRNTLKMLGEALCANMTETPTSPAITDFQGAER
jgi:hypothetical protein